MGVDDVEGDFVFGRDWGGGAGQDFGFEKRDAVEAPGGVGEFGDELGFGGRRGAIFVEEAAAVGFISRAVLRGEDRRIGGQAVAESVAGGALLAGGGTGTGGVEGIGAVDRGAGGGRCGTWGQ